MEVNVHQCTRVEVESRFDNPNPDRSIYWLTIEFTEEPAIGRTKSGLTVFFKDEIYCRKLAAAIHQVNAEHFPAKAKEEVEDGTLA